MNHFTQKALTAILAALPYVASSVEPDDHDEHEEHQGHGAEHEDAGAIQFTPEVMSEFGIEVAEAGPGPLKLDVALPGEVRVNEEQQAHISPRYPGLITRVRKSVGDKVASGDTLAVIESSESLAPYELKSLIAGTVIERHVTLGESVNEDDICFVVANLDTVWVDVTVYPRDFATIKPGLTALVGGGHHLPTVEGQVSYVSPIVDEHTRTATARVVLPNPDGIWRPGQFVSVRIATAEETVPVLIAPSSVTMLENQPSVFIETPDGFVPRAIKTGRSTATGVEILEGLAAGERYVRSGSFALKAEMARGELEEGGHSH